MQSHSKKKWHVLFQSAIITALLTTSSYSAGLTSSWPEEYYNPKPQPDDIILPMPCDGAMAFRRVTIESTGPMADKRIDLGMSDDQWGFAENTIAAHIAGSFSSEKDSARSILVGKYEVNQLQYQSMKSLDNGTCKKPVKKLRLPQNKINWYDAVKFTNDWSIWLLKNAVDEIPSEDGEPGFIRLPTDTEWEYAARGGNAVSISDFRERVFPMPEGIGKYVWFAGTRSANGKAQLTGLLLPNSLGLHDILGNVEEITLEPFRLNRLNRLHGQVGGYVVRGGNYFTSQEDIRSSHRQEVPYFDKSGARRSKTTGIRVVVSAPILTSPERVREIQREWSLLGTEITRGGEGKDRVYVDSRAKEDPIAELQVLAKASDDKNMTMRLKRLESVMRGTFEDRNQQRDSAVRVSLRSGGIICEQIGEDANHVSIRSNRYKRLCVDSETYNKEECKKRSEQLATIKDKFTNNLNLYADNLIRVARNYDQKTLVNQGKVLQTELTTTPTGRKLGEFVDIYFSQLIDYNQNWFVKRTQWAETCRRAIIEN